MLSEVADEARADLGAYEHDPDEYWIPGRQLGAAPTTPVPFDGAEAAAADTTRGCEGLSDFYILPLPWSLNLIT